MRPLATSPPKAATWPRRRGDTMVRNSGTTGARLQYHTQHSQRAITTRADRNRMVAPLREIDVDPTQTEFFKKLKHAKKIITKNKMLNSES